MCWDNIFCHKDCTVTVLKYGHCLEVCWMVTGILITRIAAMCTYPVQPVCTSLLFILLFINPQYTVFLHILLFCTFYFIAHFTLISPFFYIYIYIYIYALVLSIIIFIFIILHCPLSGPDFTYISLLIIPCIIYYVTNKQTLKPWENYFWDEWVFAAFIFFWWVCQLIFHEQVLNICLNCYK